MKYYVYIHTTPSNKTYVGVTKRDPEKRWRNGDGYRSNQHFYNAIKKYGWNNISHEVIEVYSEERMYELEKLLISMLKSNDIRYGYNKSIGGEISCLKYSTDEERKDAHNKSWKEFYMNHCEQIKEYNHDYYETHHEWLRQHHHEYYMSHLDQKKKYIQNWKGENPNYHKKWREKNSDYHKKWRESHPDYYQKYYRDNKKTNK